MTRKVWFHRNFNRINGGQLKHSHYFDHVLRMPGFSPRITFSGDIATESRARERRQLWPAADEFAVPCWQPGSRDVFFLGGVDWRYLVGNGFDVLDNPRINLVQQIRNLRKGTELYRNLSERAIRVCVSQEVADAVVATGRANGPVLTVPNGIDLTQFVSSGEGSAAEYEARRPQATIIGYKNPDTGRALSEGLDAEGIQHLLVTDFLDRGAFLGLLSESRVAVCLPRAEEGFYLVALEAMASGCTVVTQDCVGNRGFCRHAENCLLAEHDAKSLLGMTKRALAMGAPQRGRLHARARSTAVEYSLDVEKVRFHAILSDIDRLWRMR